MMSMASVLSLFIAALPLLCSMHHAQELKAKELMWTDMLPAEQAAAILLGWNAAMWDEGETPACVDMHWAELSVAEVGAATTMGYTEEDWDAEEEDDGGDETLRV